MRGPAFPIPVATIHSTEMSQIGVGDLVSVQGLLNQTRYNGCRGMVRKLIVRDPDDKCEIAIIREQATGEKRLILKTRCLDLVARRGAPPPPRPLSYTERQELYDHLPRAPPIGPMFWGCAEIREVFEQDWTQRITENDPVWFHHADCNVWLYLIQKLAALIRRGNQIGQAAWSFSLRKVGDLHYGYVWGHGGREQEEELPSGSAADIMAAGSQWWPVVWVFIGGVLVPVYCPGLAWQNARPWFAHCSRLREVEPPRDTIKKLESGWVIL